MIISNKDHGTAKDHGTKKDEGFTLVELLIVIVILGILATVTVFAVAGITSTAQENACGVEEKTILTAVESYKAVEQTEEWTLADLEDYLTESVNLERWSVVDGALVGVGVCEDD